MPRIPVNLPNDLKQELADLSADLGVSQNAITIIALTSLIKNYEVKGKRIFINVLEIGSEDADQRKC